MGWMTAVLKVHWTAEMMVLLMDKQWADVMAFAMVER